MKIEWLDDVLFPRLRGGLLHRRWYTSFAGGWHIVELPMREVELWGDWTWT